MGEVGIGTPTPWHVNTQNPANLIYNNFSSFQVGVEMDQRNFTADDFTGSDAGGGLRFLGYAFPIKPGKWSSSFGILPYSSVNYNTFSETLIENAPNNAREIVDERGEGGLTSLFWSNGIRLTKGLAIGIRSSFTFGSISKESNILVTEEIEVTDPTGQEVTVEVPIGNTSQVDFQQSYSDINFQFGLTYRHKLTDQKFLDFGMIYTPKSVLSGSSELLLRRISSTGTEIESQEVSNSSFDQDLPLGVGFGASYQKVNHYTIGFDFESQQWSNIENENYNNFTKIAFGLSWIPDYDNVNSYIKRVKYFAGFNRTQLPYIVNNQSLTDFGINFGASLPVSGFSSLDLAFKWGQLGETSNGLIKENYYKIVLGATINDRWFIKRKYD